MDQLIIFSMVIAGIAALWGFCHIIRVWSVNWQLRNNTSDVRIRQLRVNAVLAGADPNNITLPYKIWKLIMWVLGIAWLVIQWAI